MNTKYIKYNNYSYQNTSKLDIIMMYFINNHYNYYNHNNHNNYYDLLLKDILKGQIANSHQERS